MGSLKDSEGIVSKDEREADASDEEETSSPGLAGVLWLAEEGAWGVDMDERVEEVVSVLNESEADADGEDEEIEFLEVVHCFGYAFAGVAIFGGKAGNPPLWLVSYCLRPCV